MAETKLPTVIILGKQYYCYESKKGDSLFGIASHYGWDTDVLNELNPNITSPIAKGTLIYYPVTDNITSESAAGENSIVTEQVTHLVQSGETVYSICKAYDLTMNELYALNPNARHGIKAGEILVISQPKTIVTADKHSTDEEANNAPDDVIGENGEDNEYIFHNIAQGETLYSIAVKYDTRVEDIYRENPGLSPDYIAAGETIRIIPGTRSNNVKTEVVTEQSVVSIDTYKVQKGDTWGSISASLHVEQQALRDANPGKWKLKKGDTLIIPRTEEIEVSHEYTEIDPREQSPQGLRELYDEVHSIDVSMTGERETADEVKVAIILDDTATNRDMEFARGALLGIDKLKNSSFRINVMIVDGGDTMSKILTQLETFRPDLLISTSDKSLPQYLVEYSQRTGTELINTFDVKNEAYIDTPTIYQFLTPSSYFNDSVAEYIAEQFGDRTLLVIGNISNTDNVRELLSQKFSGIRNIDVADIEKFVPQDGVKYLIYATPTGQKDVESLMENISAMVSSNPLADIKVIGRANWVTFGRKLSEKYSDINFLVPSRFYFNPDDIDSRRFINDYQQLYGHTPIKSYPVYSVVGYDIITSFLPNIHNHNGDFNANFNVSGTLQSDIVLERINNWSGLYNPSCYILDYNMAGEPFKIRLTR
ncbi:MAG: LysM peptidoglycan-binding domain-containing protein [Muribaculaceae bacterium]|nr:LysM peptidoglycan-binding domain-containing protein [Muribaculaceae bacterium]